MNNSWEKIFFGDLLRKSEEMIEIYPTNTYQQITVRMWGNGVVSRGLVLGSNLGSSRWYVARHMQFIFSRIDARHGAFGLVPFSLDGAIVSNDFPLFDIDSTKLLPDYLYWLSKTHDFVDLCKRVSEGTTNRVRLKIERFLSTETLLPPLEEQHRIVAYIEALATRIAEARGLRHDAEEKVKALFEVAQLQLLRFDGKTTVKDYATIQSGYSFKSDWYSDKGIRLIRNVNISHGYIDWSNTTFLSESQRVTFQRFELTDGDILVSLDRPIISTGIKVARVKIIDTPSLLVQRVGRVQFLSENVVPDYMFAWLRSPYFVNSIDPGRSNGVPHISPKDIENLPFSPPEIHEQRRVVAYLDTLQAQMEDLKRLQAEIAAELDALLPSVLDRAFKGELI